MYVIHQTEKKRRRYLIRKEKNIYCLETPSWKHCGLELPSMLPPPSSDSMSPKRMEEEKTSERLTWERQNQPEHTLWRRRNESKKEAANCASPCCVNFQKNEAGLAQCLVHRSHTINKIECILLSSPFFPSIFFYLCFVFLQLFNTHVTLILFCFEGGNHSTVIKVLLTASLPAFLTT